MTRPSPTAKATSAPVPGVPVPAPDTPVPAPLDELLAAVLLAPLLPAVVVLAVLLVAPVPVVVVELACDDVDEPVDCDDVVVAVGDGVTQSSASLSADEMTTSSRPSALMCTAFTVVPWSWVAGICSLNSSVIPSALIVVSGAGSTSTLRGRPPTEIDAIVLSPLELEHVLVEVDCTKPT